MSEEAAWTGAISKLSRQDIHISISITAKETLDRSNQHSASTGPKDDVAPVMNNLWSTTRVASSRNLPRLPTAWRLASSYIKHLIDISGALPHKESLEALI